MLKTYQIIIPLPQQESFELVRRSGAEIVSWRNNNADEESGYLDWKQSFWSLTGSALITAQLKPETEQETMVTVSVHKPLQVMDPLGICQKIFNKLLKSLEKNISKSEQYKDLTLKVT